MQVLDFTQHEHDWWAWFLTHNAAAVDSITSAEGFDPKNLEVEIKVNGVDVLAKPFNVLMQALVDMACAQQLENQGLTSIREAGVKAGAEVLKKLYSDFSDKSHTFMCLLEDLNSSAESMMQDFYNRGFNKNAGEEMANILAKARIVNDRKEKYQSYEAHIELTENSPMGHATFGATGFGANEGEARKELERIVYQTFGIKPLTE